jgi:hypothetical protein
MDFLLLTNTPICLPHSHPTHPPTHTRSLALLLPQQPLLSPPLLCTVSRYQRAMRQIMFDVADDLRRTVAQSEALKAMDQEQAARAHAIYFKTYIAEAIGANAEGGNKVRVVARPCTHTHTYTHAHAHTHTHTHTHKHTHTHAHTHTHTHTAE